MKKQFFFVLVIVVLSTGLILTSYTQVRIMCLGESITGSPGCWRALLWQSLENTGYTNTDFVGTQYPQGCGFDYDGEHEGHGGLLVTNAADQNQLVDWLSASNPDIVLMHFGTNDCWSARETSIILAAYTTLVNQMRANNANMIILVARIIPMDPTRSCSDCDQRVINLNAAIPGWANGMNTSQSPVIVVDQWTGFSYTDDTYDGVHPDASGDQKIADKWYPALIPYLSSDPNNTPVPTLAPTGVPGLMGDVNESGAIDIVDALLVAQYYVGLNPAGFNSAYADVSNDGNIDIVDALLIAQCYVGLVLCNF